MNRDLWEDEYEALLELAVMGPVQPGRFDRPSVTESTETRLRDAGLIVLENGAYVMTATGRQALNREGARRHHGWRVIDGGAGLKEGS